MGYRAAYLPTSSSSSVDPSAISGVLLSSINIGLQIHSIADRIEKKLCLPLDEWAEKYITLSSKYSARATKLRLYGWQREMFRAYTEERVNEITICSSTQLTKTLLQQCALAYSVVEDPGPFLVVQPKEEDAKAFSKERFTPMVEDCEILQTRITGSEKDGNTILQKEFPGGFVAFVGAIAPGNLARRPIRCIFFDEIDKYPLSAGKEGDPLTLGRERTVTFGSKRKILYSCSPTEAGNSRIWTSYLQSDQRKPYVKCWQCGHAQVLNFRNGVKWDSSLPRDKQPASAHYLCANKDCNAHWDDYQRWRACEKTEWRAHAPFTGHAGFWINHLYSPHKTLGTIVDDFLKAQSDRNLLKAFVNTTLAEVWQEAGSAPDSELLYARREDYPHSQEAVVPRRALFLTAAVDVQDNRLEVEVCGWGRNRERWSVGYFVIQEQLDGEILPSTHPRLWERLDQEILSTLWQHEKGGQMPILCMCVDTGYKPKAVYDFCATKSKLAVGPAGANVVMPRTVVAVKGTDDQLRLIKSISKEDASKKRQNVRIVSIGTYVAKQEIFDVLNGVRPRADGKAVPQCYHFPMYDLEYFNMLSAEIRVVHEDGKVDYIKKQNARNEALDCFDAKTEVLTRRGWLYFKDLEMTDRVATVNLKKDLMEFQKPSRLIAKPYSGPMVKIQGKRKRIDILVTPQHRMVTYKKEYRYVSSGVRKWFFDTPPKITLAEDLTIHHQLKVSADWKGARHTHIKIRASKRTGVHKSKIIESERVVNLGDLAELAGWFAAEGSSWQGQSVTQPNSTRSKILIYQNKGDKFDRIKALLERLPWNFHVGKRGKDRKQHYFCITSKQLYDFLSDGGRNVYNKRVPDWVKVSSREIISRFMGAAVQGDGWIQARNSRTVATVSKELADGYQELFLKMGFASNITIRKPSKCSLSSQPDRLGKKQYWVNEINGQGSRRASLDGGGNGKREYIGKTVRYKGMVYCATVPNGTLVCRRNGKSFIAGNCAVYNRAAAALVGIDRFKEHHWQQMEEQLGITQSEKEKDAVLPEESEFLDENDEKIEVSSGFLQSQTAPAPPSVPPTAVSAAPSSARALPPTHSPLEPSPFNSTSSARRVRFRF